jgi:hypothetical protein
VLKASSYIVTLWLLVNVKIFNTFHIFMMRPYYGNGVPRQSETNDDARANRDWEVI